MVFRVVWKSEQIFFPFCHNSRVLQTNGRTDRQMDGRSEFSSLGRVCIPCRAVKIKHLRNITLLTYLLHCPAARVPIMNSRSWGTVGQSADESAIDGERVFAPTYGPKDILSSNNMLIDWAVIEAVKQWSTRRMFFFKSVNNSQGYYKSLA